jgi:CDP-glucose 4,6-dehydratase
VEGRRRALEDMELSAASWRGRKVLITGHTGFKGAWLSLWLIELGARVTGFALAPPTKPSLFELTRVGDRLKHVEGDIRDAAALVRAFRSAEPELVLHLAAQSLVRTSYREPVETYETNVIGTVNVLEACRAVPSIRAVLIVTSDKCYQHHPSGTPYREGDPLGGHDPYSSSKACAELVSAAYRQSYFSSPKTPVLATARAGNVIGGGDFAADRLIPDIVRTLESGEQLVVRNPRAVRPWQHVLEPLAGYLLLAERLCGNDRASGEAWNFGPRIDDSQTVEWVLGRALPLFGLPQKWKVQPQPALPEAALLTIDSSKAQARLGWSPRLGIDTALEWTARWYTACRQGSNPQAVTLEQIREYMK